MDTKNLLTKLKAVFSAEQEIETKFIDIKTMDSRILRVSDMAVEASIVEITEEGEVALLDGEYKLEDGIVLSVKDGMISEIIPATEEEEKEEQEEIVTEMAEEVIDEEVLTDEIIEEEIVKELVSNIKALIEEVATLKSEFTSIKEENKELKTKVEKFSKEPSAESTITKVNFKSEKPKSLLQQMIENK